ncbi:MAG: hypothetical protein PF630_05420 [Gammaproteobacteria bacterium]|nr:hypothetical protein [Gammaproteobacteria bacterium]
MISTNSTELHTKSAAGNSLPTATTAQSVAKISQDFDTALTQLEQAAVFAKERYQTDVFQLAGQLLQSNEGMLALQQYAQRFDAAGVFHKGPWEHPDKLMPQLVGGGLLGETVYPLLESLSELRMLAIATGKSEHAQMSAQQAIQFLRDVIINNLDLMFGDSSEASRQRPQIFARAQRLLNLIAEQIPMAGLRDEVVAEIGFIQAQRPILVQRSIDLIHYAERLPKQDETAASSELLETYVRALGKPGPLSQASDDLTDYRRLLRKAESRQIEAECKAFAYTLQETGLSNPWHAVLLRFLGRQHPELLAMALGVNDYGIATISEDESLAVDLLRVAITPATHAAIYGFAGLLERGLLNRPAVAAGLRRLVDLDIHPEVTKLLLENYPKGHGLTANMILLAGTFSVLGQPLGIGQGHNPTCQAARGISLWSRHEPNYLLELIATAARNDLVEIEFEGVQLSSADLLGGVAGGKIDACLDPVSRLLVPHLDRLYDEFMRRAALRGEDGHKWVNRALYGRQIASGFASILDITGCVSGYEDFLRLFYASHHPEYNDEHELIYPNPVGLLITDIHGRLLGPHAVSILRVAADTDNNLRIYFFNPNNEGRQNWGQDIKPTVSGHGEIPGESSLPFEQFVSRLYAYHYSPYETGDAFAVAAEVLQRIEAMARSSWGAAYTWL